MSTVTDEIKSRVDLVELIGRSVALRRVGSSHRGLCPFHTEKTPSFYVFPHTGTWYCFGCSKRGTAFDWLMEREHLDFGEALRTLAQITGVALPERRDPSEEEATRRLYAILERSQTYYQGVLWGSAGAAARAYLARRGLTEDTLRSFGLGYAASGNGLLRYLESDGFAIDELQAAGVISVSDDGRPFDFFRERVLFPIRDGQGRTIAFGGRSVEDGTTPKYLNSRDTLLFHKQETLFAFDAARRTMAQERQVVIVEGYMDALMAHQHGYRNVVATLGTAVSERHLRLLRRHVDEIVLALDADAAGQAATWRALQLADQSLRTGLTPVVGPSRRQRRYVPDRAVRLRILTLPGAKDPDELIRADPTAWPALVRAATPVIDFVLRRLEDRHDLATAEGKAAAAEDIAEVLAGIANPIEQAHYVQQVAQLLKVDEAAVRQALKRRQRWISSRHSDQSADGQTEQHAGATTPDEQQQGDALDEYALALLVRSRELNGAQAAATEDFEFVLPESRGLVRCLGAEPPAELRPLLRRVERRLPDVARLSAAQLEVELERTRLTMRKRALLERKAQLALLIRDTTDDGEHLELARTISELAQAIESIERQLQGSQPGSLPEREQVGLR